MKWRATMPKGKPKEGHVMIVFAMKTSTGARMEEEAEITREKADAIWDVLLGTDNSLGAAAASLTNNQ